MNKIFFNEYKYSNWSVVESDSTRIDQIIKLAGNTKKILDIGCGIGEIGKQLIQNNNAVYGVDISKSAIRKAIKNGIKAEVCDIENQEIPFNFKFDCVIASEIIEHIFDTDHFLIKIKGKLKKNGFLIITTPNIATLGRRLLLMLGKNPLIETSLKNFAAGHIRYFTFDTLKDLLEYHKLKIVYFSSDVINFNQKGSVSSSYLAKLFPKLGRTLIIKAVYK